MKICVNSPPGVSVGIPLTLVQILYSVSSSRWSCCVVSDHDPLTSPCQRKASQEANLSMGIHRSGKSIFAITHREGYFSILLLFCRFFVFPYYIFLKASTIYNTFINTSVFSLSPTIFFMPTKF